MEYVIYPRLAMDGRPSGRTIRRTRDWEEALRMVLRMGGEKAVALYERDDAPGPEAERGPLNFNVDWRAVRARFGRNGRKEVA